MTIEFISFIIAASQNVRVYIVMLRIFPNKKKSEQMSIGIIERRYAVNIYLIHGTTYVSQYSLVLIIAFTFNIL